MSGLHVEAMGPNLPPQPGPWPQSTGGGAAPLDALLALSRIVSGTGDAAGKLRAAADLILSLMGEAVVAIGVPASSANVVDWLEVRDGRGTLERHLGRTEPVGGLAARALAELTPQFVDEVTLAGQRLLGNFAGLGRSAAAVPLVVDKEAAGILLITAVRPRAFPQDIQHRLAAMAAILGPYLKAARLRQELDLVRRKEQERLDAYQTAAARLALEVSPDAALAQFVDSARRLAGAKYGGVVVWGRDGQVRNLVSQGLPAGDAALGLQRNSVLHLDEVLGLVRYALVHEKKKVVRVSDSSLIQNAADPEIPLLRSLLGVPFTTKDGSPGAFFLVDKEEAPRFNPEDEQLLKLFSSMAAVLLDNIQLYRDVERQRNTLEAIQSSMAEGLIVLDRESRIVVSNGAVSRLLSLDSPVPNGVRLPDLVLDSLSCFETPEAAQRLGELLKGPIEEPVEVEVTVRSPKRVDLAISVFPIVVTADERLTGLLLRDVTDERDLQRRRDTFVSVASHELRTPMTTVMGFTELLLERDPAPPQRRAWLQHILEDSRRVVRIVEDLLNVSRIQSGKVTVNLVATDVAALMRTAVETLESSTDIHHLTVTADEGLPLVLGDPDKVMQVLVNLITNAIKYSPQGGRIALHARHDAPMRRVVVSVSDEGLGIAEEDQEGLFTTFQRIDRDETRGISGTGLGLYIVKNLVDLMNGSVWLESALGQGSTFFFSLPVAEAP